MDIGDSFQNAIGSIIGFLPNLIGFLLILLIGYLIAKVVAKVVAKLVEKAGIDSKLRDSSASRHLDAVLSGTSVARGIAAVVFWLIFVFFIVTAIGALGLPAATGFMNQVLAYLPNVIVAILIFVIAALLSGAVAGAVVRFMGDTPTGKIVASVVPALIMVIAFFMILEQLQIAPEIVRIAFTAVVFALALGLALAFGLGGREIAAELLRDARHKASDAVEQGKRDVQTGSDRARSEHQGSAGSRAATSAGATGTAGSGAAPGEATQQMPAPGSHDSGTDLPPPAR